MDVLHPASRGRSGCDGFSFGPLSCRPSYPAMSQTVRPSECVLGLILTMYFWFNSTRISILKYTAVWCRRSNRSENVQGAGFHHYSIIKRTQWLFMVSLWNMWICNGRELNRDPDKRPRLWFGEQLCERIQCDIKETHSKSIATSTHDTRAVGITAHFCFKETSI